MYGVSRIKKEVVMLIANMPELRESGPVLTMGRDESVQAALYAMAGSDKGAVLVTDGNAKIEGIFTERDVLRRIAAPGVDATALRLEDVMTPDVETARTDEQVVAAIGRSDQNRFRHLPVVDEEGILAGMLTERAFSAYTFPEAAHRVAEASKASVSARYQPFTILLALLIYTVLIVSAVAYWI